jgi:hypothetical protein
MPEKKDKAIGRHKFILEDRRKKCHNIGPTKSHFWSSTLKQKNEITSCRHQFIFNTDINSKKKSKN